MSVVNVSSEQHRGRKVRSKPSLPPLLCVDHSARVTGYAAPHAPAPERHSGNSVLGARRATLVIGSGIPVQFCSPSARKLSNPNGPDNWPPQLLRTTPQYNYQISVIALITAQRSAKFLWSHHRPTSSALFPTRIPSKRPPLTCFWFADAHQHSLKL